VIVKGKPKTKDKVIEHACTYRADFVVTDKFGEESFLKKTLFEKIAETETSLNALKKAAELMRSNVEVRG